MKLKCFYTAKETIDKKTTHRIGENTCKQCDRQEITLQNLQTAHAAQYQRNKQPNPKMAEDLNIHFSQEDMQMANRHMEDARYH